MGSINYDTEQLPPIDPILKLLTFHKALYTFPLDFQFNKFKHIYETSKTAKRTYASFFLYLVFLITHSTRHIKEIVTKAMESNPVRLFEMAKILGDGIHTTCIAYTLYYKGEQIIDLINLFHSKRSFSSKCLAKDIKWSRRVGNFAFYASVGIFLVLRVTDHLLINDWKINQHLVELYAEKGITYLPIDLNVKKENVAWFGLTIYMIARILGAIYWSFGDWGNIVVGLTFYRVVTNFEKTVRQGELQTYQILCYFEQIRKLCSKINDAMGLMIFSLCLPLLPFFITNLVGFLNFGDFIEVLKMQVSFGILCSTLLVFTCVNLKASKALEIIVSDPKYYNEIRAPELLIIVQEFHNNRIAFSGLGLFKVTSGFLGSITGLILTFAIILIQFQQEKNG